MNNSEVDSIIDECKLELDNIEKIVNNLKQTSNIIPFLTKYAVIKTCGTIELSFKTLISDFCSNNQNEQIKNYISKTVRESSINPTKDNICSLLLKFDKDWNIAFKEKLNLQKNKEKILFSLKSLNESRNTFAHGGNPTTTFQSVKDYFNDCIEIIFILDNILQ